MVRRLACDLQRNLTSNGRSMAVDREFDDIGAVLEAPWAILDAFEQFRSILQAILEPTLDTLG